MIRMKSQDRNNQYSEKIRTLISFKVTHFSPTVVPIPLIPQLESEGKNVFFL